MSEIDEDEFQYWFEQGDAAIEREIGRLEREYCAMIDAMSVAEQIEYFRGYLLRTIRENRARLRNPKLARIEVIDDLWGKSIRSSQLRLLKLRIWRQTGVYPGDA